jgi:hypothetical protein
MKMRHQRLERLAMRSMFLALLNARRPSGPKHFCTGDRPTPMRSLRRPGAGCLRTGPAALAGLPMPHCGQPAPAHVVQRCARRSTTAIGTTTPAPRPPCTLGRYRA